MLYKRNDTLALSLALMFITLFTIVMNVSYKGQISEAEKEIEILKESEKIKENEISKLESEIESVYENLSEKENSILEVEEKLKNSESENEKLKKELEKYDSLRKLNMIATAYTSECDGCIGITSTGYDVRKNKTYNGMKIIASDPNIIPMNSVVLIKTDNSSFKAISLDTGGAIEGNRIDILMDTKDDAYNFGRQNVEVTILKEG